MPRDGYLVFPELVEFASPRSVEARPLSAQELMATPDHMLAWLKSKPAEEIVARDMWNAEHCLGATFLRENGHPRALVLSRGGWVRRFGDRFDICPAISATIERLTVTGGWAHVTAADAIAALAHESQRNRRSEIGA